MSLQAWFDYNAKQKSRPDSDVIEFEPVNCVDGILVTEGLAAEREIFGEAEDAS